MDILNDRPPKLLSWNTFSNEQSANKGIPHTIINITRTSYRNAESDFLVIMPEYRPNRCHPSRKIELTERKFGSGQWSWWVPSRRTVAGRAGEAFGCLSTEAAIDHRALSILPFQHVPSLAFYPSYYWPWNIE